MRSCVSWTMCLLLGCSALVPMACYQPRVSDDPGEKTTEPGPAERAAANPGPIPRIWFEDMAGASGVHFRHIDGATDMHYVAETVGAGVAWIDFDQDGYLDLFL